MRISRIARSQVSWAALSEQLCRAWGEHAQNFVPCFPNAVGTRLAFSERRKVKASSALVGIGSSVALARDPSKVGRPPAIFDRDKTAGGLNKAPVRVSFFYQVASTISGALWPVAETTLVGTRDAG
jgi:hypothetical protein